MLRTSVPDSFVVAWDALSLNLVAADLAHIGGVSLECRVVSVLVTGIVANDLLSSLQAAARPPRTVILLPAGPRLAHLATDRLSAWEYSLATEATAQQAVCHGCGGQDVTPVTAFDGKERSMVTWCVRYQATTTLWVDAAAYAASSELYIHDISRSRSSSESMSSSSRRQCPQPHGWVA